MARDGRASPGDQFRSIAHEARDLYSEVGGLAGDVQRLLRLQGELARAEAGEAIGLAGRGAGLGAAAIVVGIITLAFLFLALMSAVNTAAPQWLAALITAGVAFLLTALLAGLALWQLRRFSPLPRRFIRSVREDIEWAGAQISSSTR
ncbi:MAG TPA: phage holin family protein [Dehalococcoidia bacterium]|nr:phage holin family protein [Dehalococcoidia bacterium]